MLLTSPLLDISGGRKVDAHHLIRVKEAKRVESLFNLAYGESD
jgi:hypothetical protein